MEWTRDSRITYYVLFSKLTQDKPVFVQASVGAGFGLFAAKDFKVGELVLAEEPFVVLPSKATSEEQVEKELTKIIENLDETKRVLFWSFSDKHIPKASNSKRTVKGIVETNGLPMGDRIRDRIPSKAGMYQFLCRLNHSCRPNVHHQWNSLLKRQTIYAIRSIKAGEELFTAYFDCSGLTSQQRQCLTLAKWNFVCKCVKCTQTNALLIQSDKKQTEIAALDEAIPLMAMLNTRKALELVKERIKLMKEEDSYDFTELVRSEYDAYQIWYFSISRLLK